MKMQNLTIKAITIGVGLFMITACGAKDLFNGTASVSAVGSTHASGNSSGDGSGKGHSSHGEDGEGGSGSTICHIPPGEPCKLHTLVVGAPRSMPTWATAITWALVSNE